MDSESRVTLIFKIKKIWGSRFPILALLSPRQKIDEIQPVKPYGLGQDMILYMRKMYGSYMIIYALIL